MRAMAAVLPDDQATVDVAAYVRTFAGREGTP
jgi:hypothetical protein